MRFAFLMALTACATYRVVPPAPLAAGVRPIVLRTEKSRLWLSSAGEDCAVGGGFGGGDAGRAPGRGPGEGRPAPPTARGTGRSAPGPPGFPSRCFAAGRS